MYQWKLGYQWSSEETANNFIKSDNEIRLHQEWNYYMAIVILFKHLEINDYHFR